MKPSTNAAGCHRSPGLLCPKQHDHEQEEHHDRAGIYRHLCQGDKWGIQPQVEYGDCSEINDQEQRRVHCIAAEQHAQRRYNSDQGEDKEENDL
jgi:hypothetical protein